MFKKPSEIDKINEEFDLLGELISPEEAEDSLNTLAEIYASDRDAFKELLMNNEELVKKILTMSYLMRVEHMIARVIRQLDRSFDEIYCDIKEELDKVRFEMVHLSCVLLHFLVENEIITCFFWQKMFAVAAKHRPWHINFKI